MYFDDKVTYVKANVTFALIVLTQVMYACTYKRDFNHCNFLKGGGFEAPIAVHFMCVYVVLRNVSSNMCKVQ